MIFIFIFMFVRNLRHKNEKIYVQVFSKTSRKYKVLKSFSSCKTPSELELLHTKAQQWINQTKGSFEFDFDNEKTLFDNLLNNITALKLSGIDLVLDKIFNKIGFNKIEDDLFKDLVLYRLVYPKNLSSIINIELIDWFSVYQIKN